jgi:FAD/FMN-containing dehydrogenase/Fe-S oxidoreductase
MATLHSDLVTLEPPRPPAEWSGDAAALGKELARNVSGEVRFDAGSRALYATDGSNYRQVPIGVVVPRTIDDVLATIATCRSFGAPVLSRGGGTSLAGQTCNVAVVMDWTKYVNQILEINVEEKFARVRPGVVLDHLRAAAKPHHLTFGPDPSTHAWCTLGGMIGNNSCGTHSQMAGKTVDNMEEMELVTYDGLRMRAAWMTQAELEQRAKESGRVGEIFRGIVSIQQRFAGLIKEKYPNIPRRVSGYNLDQLLPDANGRFNLARALVGSEGTLVTVLEAKLRLVHDPAFRSVLVLGYPDIYQAADAVPELVQSKPIALEAIDHLLFENMRKKRLHENYLGLLPKGKGWLLVQFGGESREESKGKAEELMHKLGAKPNAPDMKLYGDDADAKHLWEIRESGLGATAFVPGEPVTWEGWEDSAVAPEKLGDYLRELCKLYEKFGYIGALYGHFGMGCVHTRISFDLFTKPGVAHYRQFMEEAADLVVSYGGSLSGEHGDGQSRAELLPKMFGPELVGAFGEFKQLWDPQWKMNPGKVVHPFRIDENRRLTHEADRWDPKTHFQFPDDQYSFKRATLRCVGVGKCRRTIGQEPGDDTMCPSFLITHDEEHTTRGRTHLLFELLKGEELKPKWRDEHVKEALDLCLACKGCKGDCPVNVDVATYKAEFLSHYWEGRLRPRHAYAFGWIDKWARLAALWPGMVNLLTQAPGISSIAKLAAGVAPERKIPQFAPTTFKSWFFSRPRANRTGKRVLLWADTFNNHFHPEVARAAVDVLENLGFDVEVPRARLCCGRPLYDFGMLDQAKSYLRNILGELHQQIEAGTPVVVLEPSCASVLRDEMHNLFPDDPHARKLAAQTDTFGAFLEKNSGNLKLPQIPRKLMVHAHCHHKAIMKTNQDETLLKKMGGDYELLNSGCCGMAGSFGFEADKYRASVEIGERTLLPKVREAAPEAILVADGFSCREQVEQLTDRHALHTAEVVSMAMHNKFPKAGNPEAEVVGLRRRELQRSRRRAGIALALGAAGAAALSMLWARRRD